MRRALLLVVVGCGSSPSGPLPSGAGGVSLGVVDNATEHDGSAQAYFPGGDFDIPCASHSTVGMCLVSQHCDESNLTYPPVLPFGAVVVTGTTPTVTLEGPSSAPFPTPLYAGGETLTFDGGGDDVPRFNGTLIAPGKLVVSGPATRPADDADLPLTWTGTSSGQVIVTLFGGPLSDITAVDCSFPASDGQAVIPGSLRTLAPGNEIRTDVTTTLTVGGWTIDLVADFDAVDVNDAPAASVL